MNWNRVLLVGLFVLVTLVRTEGQAGLVNDREIKVHTRKEIQEKRRALERYIWGEAGFPKELVPHPENRIRAALLAQQRPGPFAKR